MFIAGSGRPRVLGPIELRALINQNTAIPLPKSEKIRVLNDNFRSTYTGGTVVLTQGVNNLLSDVKARLLAAVRSFGNFTKDNDPYGEHDFGSIELDGQTWSFTIDYYATPDMDGGSEDPADPARTVRVMTIMRADEY
jgi:hypothetical protein